MQIWHRYLLIRLSVPTDGWLHHPLIMRTKMAICLPKNQLQEVNWIYQPISLHLLF